MPLSSSDCAKEVTVEMHAIPVQRLELFFDRAKNSGDITKTFGDTTKFESAYAMVSLALDLRYIKCSTHTCMQILSSTCK